MKAAFSITLILILPFVYSKAPSYCPTGKEGNIWYFGGLSANDTPPIGLDFSDFLTGQPAFLDDGEMRSYEAAAIMCDANGQLLFSSNGRHVWNRDQQIMPNSLWIDGNQSTTQIMALPWPGHDGQYFLIYPEAIEATNLFQNPEATAYRVTGNCAAVDFVWEVLLEEGDTAWVRFDMPGDYELVAHQVTPCATFSDTMQVRVPGGRPPPIRFSFAKRTA